MATVDMSKHIDASRDEIFAFLDKPQNVADITPGLKRLEEIERTEEGAAHTKYTYEMVGMEFEGESHPTAYERPHRFGFDIEGAMNARLTWTMEEDDSGTTVKFHGEYETPEGAVGKVADSAVEKYNEKQVGEMLENLQKRMS